LTKPRLDVVLTSGFVLLVCFQDDVPVTQPKQQGFVQNVEQAAAPVAAEAQAQ
jgi:hypothetical protein